jgi:hypothetical protein
MKPMTNAKARQLSSVPTTHRAATLNAISQKAHSNDARIEFLMVEGQRLKEIVQNAPGAGQSRIDWIHKQLHQT